MVIPSEQHYDQIAMHERRALISNKQTLNDWLTYELHKYGRSRHNIRNVISLSEIDIIVKHQIFLRKYEYSINTNKRISRLFYKFKLNRIQSRYGLHIPPNVCGRGLKIMHLGSILMNPNSSVGEDCSIHINTALVAGGTNDSAPILGDHVVVGIGAIVLGKVCVADYTAIGANAVVNKDVVETNICVAGVPARKISMNGSRSWNKKNKPNAN